MLASEFSDLAQTMTMGRRLPGSRESCYTEGPCRNQDLFGLGQEDMFGFGQVRLPGSGASSGGDLFGVALPPGEPGARSVYAPDELFGLGQEAAKFQLNRASLEEISLIAAFGGGSAVSLLAAASSSTKATEKTAYTILGASLGAMAVFKVGKLFNIF